MPSSGSVDVNCPIINVDCQSGGKGRG